jgi:lysyl-tRNA synthetase class 2
MLEWYRPGYNLAELQREVTDLIQVLSSSSVQFAAPIVVPYRALFNQHFGVDPHSASVSQLREQVTQHFPDYLGHIEHQDQGEKDDLLEVLFSQKIQPTLLAPHFVTEFPESQASLARTGDVGGQSVALRTELYWQGLELANGYDELRDSAELKQRIRRDNTIRQSRDLPTIAADPELLEAIETMPACAGIALGIDRLLMVLAGTYRIGEVLN